MNETELKTLPNKTLLTKMESLVREERRITTEVLQCLREVESRMLHAELGYSSLYEFCTKHLHYSEGSAHRRISAMRLLRNLPEEVQKLTEDKMREGALTITNLSTLQGFLKTEKKVCGKIYSAHEKVELIQSLEHQSKREVEKKLAVIQPQILPQESQRILTADLTEIKFLADENLMKKLKRVREIIAHRDAHPSHVDLLHRLADDFLKRHDLLNKAKRMLNKVSTSPATKHSVKLVVNKQASSTSSPSSLSNTRHIPAATRKEVWLRDGGKCTYIHHETKQKCDSRYGLEIDHRMPYALGGTHELENLRLLCREHNQYQAKRVFG